MANDDRVRQVATTRERYGKDHYARIGGEGGKNSPTKFDPKSASAASKKRWDAVKEAKTKEEERIQNGQT